MQSFQAALTQHLTRLGLPVYLAGQVPGNALFPYLTLDLGFGGFGAAVPVTVQAWFLGRRANQDRAGWCDAARAIFPEKGVKLPLGNALAVVRRGAGECISLRTDETEPRVLGATLRLTATLYDL